MNQMKLRTTPCGREIQASVKHHEHEGRCSSCLVVKIQELELQNQELQKELDTERQCIVAKDPDRNPCGKLAMVCVDHREEVVRKLEETLRLLDEFKRRGNELMRLASYTHSESPVFWDAWYKLFNLLTEPEKRCEVSCQLLGAFGGFPCGEPLPCKLHNPEKRKDEGPTCTMCGWNNDRDHGGGSRKMYTMGTVTKCGECMPTTR